MKKKLLLTTTLAAVLAAATIPTAAAFAAQADGYTAPVYPSSFVCDFGEIEEGLTDFAIDGDTYAFAVKTNIFVIYTDDSGDRKLTSYDHGKQITKLDYAESHLYFQNNSSETYTFLSPFPDVKEDRPKAESANYTFPVPTSFVEIGEDKYYITNKSELKLIKDGGESGVDEVLIGEGYSQLKKYDGEAYAVKDNLPYVLHEQSATPLDLRYTNFSLADGITAQPVRDLLKLGGYEVKTATLKGGSYYTQIDADDKLSENLKQYGSKTQKANGVISCLVLTSGRQGTDDIAVIAAGGNCYVTATKNLIFTAYTAPANDWELGPDGSRKAFVREFTGVYTSPYMSENTLIERVAKTKPLAVTVEEKFTLDFIDTVYYKVAYQNEDGQTVKGFVAAGYLDKYDYSADVNVSAGGETEDFTYKNNILTVVLVLVVIALVIIAIAYLVYIATQKEKGEKTKPAKPDEE